MRRKPPTRSCATLYGDDEFMGRWAVSSAAVPSKLAVREWPEFQAPKIQTFMLTAPYRAPFGGEEFPRQREIAKTGIGISAPGHVDR